MTRDEHRELDAQLNRIAIKQRAMCKARHPNASPFGDAATYDAYKEDEIRTERAIQTLLACVQIGLELGEDSRESILTCVASFDRGSYRLRPDSDALCLNFEICGMGGGMVFFRSNRTWSLHS